MLRRLSHAVLRHYDGPPTDDATLLVVEMVPRGRGQGPAMNESAPITVRRLAGVNVVQPQGNVCFGEHEPLLEALLLVAETDHPRL
jgi:hypothetical protein